MFLLVALIFLTFHKYNRFFNKILGIIEELGLDIIPYIVFLIVPMLGRMCDQNEQVRLLATHCFASLIKLMPLEVSFLIFLL